MVDDKRKNESQDEAAHRDLLATAPPRVKKAIETLRETHKKGQRIYLQDIPKSTIGWLVELGVATGSQMPASMRQGMILRRSDYDPNIYFYCG